MSDSPSLDRIDHLAIPVEDIGRAVNWYRSRFATRVLYQDQTWALLEFANVRLALVLPEQHPPHIALRRADAASFGPLTRHRDGTRSIYIRDSEGNSVEIMDLGAQTPVRT